MREWYKKWRLSQWNSSMAVHKRMNNVLSPSKTTNLTTYPYVPGMTGNAEVTRRLYGGILPTGKCDDDDYLNTRSHRFYSFFYFFFNYVFNGFVPHSPPSWLWLWHYCVKFFLSFSYYSFCSAPCNAKRVL